jgi:predicted kinase
MIPTRIRNLLLRAEKFKDARVEHHPEPNVRNHLGQVASLAIEAQEDWDMVYAAVLHDIGKDCPDNSKKWSQHAYRGAMMISQDVTEKVRWLVENHMRAIDYANGKMRPHKRKLMEEHTWHSDLMRLHTYDTNGREGHGRHLPWEMPDWYTTSETIFGYIDDMDPRCNTVVMMIGIQASGKSTVSKALVNASRDVGDWWKPEYERTCKDDIRLLVGAGPGAFRHQENCVEDIQRKAIRMALGRGQGIIIDNCHNTKKRRQRSMEWLRQEFPGLHIRAHFVYAPLEVCIQRNTDQHGQPDRHRLLIPADVLKQFHGDMKQGFGNVLNNDKAIIAALRNEGFDSVDITRTHDGET